MSTTIATIEATATVAEIDAQAIALRDAMKALADARKALMPRVNNEEREVIAGYERAIAVNETHGKTVATLKRDRQFTDEDRDQIAAARLEHKRLINTDANKSSAQFHIGRAYLSQFKLTHRKDGRIGVRVAGII